MFVPSEAVCFGTTLAWSELFFQNLEPWQELQVFGDYVGLILVLGITSIYFKIRAWPRAERSPLWGTDWVSVPFWGTSAIQASGFFVLESPKKATCWELVPFLDMFSGFLLERLSLSASQLHQLKRKRRWVTAKKRQGILEIVVNCKWFENLASITLEMLSRATAAMKHVRFLQSDQESYI